MTLAFNVVIPAIYENDNFSNTALVDIAGKPLVQHIYERAKRAGASDIVIATDSPKVGMLAEDFGATVCMIVDDSLFGMARLSYVVKKMEWSDDVNVVSVPADTPLIPEPVIVEAAESLVSHDIADCVSLYKLVDKSIAAVDETINLVTDIEDYVMYMSRALLPHSCNDIEPDFGYKCYIGISAYRTALLRILSTLSEDSFEKAENIEELILLYNGIKIYARETRADVGQRVLTEDDVEKVRALINA